MTSCLYLLMFFQHPFICMHQEYLCKRTTDVIFISLPVILICNERVFIKFSLSLDNLTPLIQVCFSRAQSCLLLISGPFVNPPQFLFCGSGMFSWVPQAGCCSWQNVSNCLKFAESNRLSSIGGVLHLLFRCLLEVEVQQLYKQQSPAETTNKRWIALELTR